MAIDELRALVDLFDRDESAVRLRHIWHWGHKNAPKGSDEYVVRVAMLYLAALKFKEDHVDEADYFERLLKAMAEQDVLTAESAEKALADARSPPPTTDPAAPTSTSPAAQTAATTPPRSRKR